MPWTFRIQDTLRYLPHMKTQLILTLLLLACAQAPAQQIQSSHAGIELDALPYITGGYFAAITAGKGLWRLRALTADVNKPDWSTRKGYSKHHVHAYALVVDRFLKQDWKGWWIGAGPVYWNSRIQTDQHLQTAHFHNWLLNGSLGYHFPLGRHFYLSPWAALNLRLGGDKEIQVDQKQYTLPFINPEASFKVGLYF